MSHRTMIGGTAYEISGGKPLVNGTAYSIDKGKVLVGGTVYEVGFAPDMVTLAIGYFPNNHYSISVDGVAYNDTTLTVPVGTIVEIEAFDIYGDCKHHDSNVSIYVNDNCVMDNDTNTTYSHTVTGNTTLSCYMMYNNCHDCYRYYYQYNVYITEAPEDYVLLTVEGYGGSVTIGESTYSNTAVFVAPGTIVTLSNQGYMGRDKESSISINDKTVVSGLGTYEYIANVNATIVMSSQYNDEYGRYDYQVKVYEQ